MSVAAAVARAARQDGYLTIQFVVAVGVSLVLLTALANLAVFQYGRGVVRAALDEAVRAGSRAGASTVECEQRAQAALSDLLGGAMGREVVVGCTASPDRVAATADVTFRGWLPFVPDWRFSAAALAVRETPP